MNKKKKSKIRLTPYLFLLPSLSFLCIFAYSTVFIAFGLSFTDYEVAEKVDFAGFTNYFKMLKDEVFWSSFGNQLIYSVCTVTSGIAFPLLAAVLLFFVRRKWLERIIKTMFVVPMMVPGIVLNLTWKFLFNLYFGFNSILEAMNLGQFARNWLNDEKTALACVIICGFPFVSGMNFLIYHAGLNNIDSELYDAAKIDGANSFHIVRYIQIPSVLPDIQTVTLLGCINSLASYGKVLSITGGGPGTASMVPAMQMYMVAFGDGKFGYGSAMGFTLFIIIFTASIVVRRRQDQKAKKEIMVK